MAQCDSCSLVQVVPMPSAREVAALYHEDLHHFDPYIDQLAVHHAYFKKKMEEITHHVIPGVTRDPSSDSGFRLRGRNDNKKNKLLDIGCAMGVLLEEARDVGFAVEGIDLSQDAVNYCNKHKLKTYNGTVYTAKQLHENSYDVITAFQIIEHEREPLKMMNRVNKLLKKGGMVVLATPNYGGFWRKVMGKRWFGFAHPEHVVLFNFESMRTLLEKSGFRGIEIRADSPRPFPLSFAFSRAGDYFPWLAWIFKPRGKLLDSFNILNPINPWDDMIVFATK